MRFHNLVGVSRAALMIAAFDGDPEVKLADVPIKDGKLVYIVAGKEELIDPVEVISGRSRIAAINSEAAGHRRRADAAEAAHLPFKDLKPDDVRAALDTVKNIKDGDLIKAGDAQKVRDEIKGSFEGQLKTASERAAALEQRLVGVLRQNAFSRSKYIADNLAIPNDVVEATFGRHFTFKDDGTMEAKDAAGNLIYSLDPAKSGTPADFDEAMKRIIDQYPSRDMILKGNQNAGSGNKGGGGNNGGKRVITRAVFDKMTPLEQSQVSIDVRTEKAVLTD